MALDAPRRFYLDKVDNRFETGDICQPSRRHHFRKVDRRFDVSDIDGAQQSSSNPSLGYSKRCTDPLNPIYQLASFVIEPPEPMRFTRDSIGVGDIEGARGTIPMFTRMKTRDHINYDDVAGSSVVRYDRRPMHDILNVADINQSQSLRSQRHTNPLSPRYDFDKGCRSGLLAFTSDGKRRPDDVDGVMRVVPDPDERFPSHRQAPHGYLSSFNLTTRDIVGNEPLYRMKKLGQLVLNRSTNRTADIVGAQADTVGWKWPRQTNPLNPVYQALDRGDPEFNLAATVNIGLVSDHRYGDVYDQQLYEDAERERLQSRDSSTTSVISADEPRMNGQTFGSAMSPGASVAANMGSERGRVVQTISDAKSVGSRSNRSSKSRRTSSTSSVSSGDKQKRAQSIKQTAERRQDIALVKALPAIM